MSLCSKCDICGEIREKGPNGLAIFDAYEEDFKPWKETARFKIRDAVNNGEAVVLDICDECKERILQYVLHDLPTELGEPGSTRKAATDEDGEEPYGIPEQVRVENWSGDEQAIFDSQGL